MSAEIVFYFQYDLEAFETDYNAIIFSQDVNYIFKILNRLYMIF